MRFEVETPRTTFYTTAGTLALRNLGFTFEHARNKSTITQFPILNIHTLEELLTLVEQHGKISLEIGDDAIPILTLENYK